MTNYPWKVMAGIAAIMTGTAQAFAPLIDLAPLVTGGVICLLGSIYVVELFEYEDTKGETA